MTTPQTTQKGRCEFVIRLAGQNSDLSPLGPSYGGDTTQTCGEWGDIVERLVTHLIRKPGSRSELIPKTVTTTRCLCDKHR